MFLQHQKSLLTLFYLALRWPGGTDHRKHSIRSELTPRRPAPILKGVF